MRLDVEELPEPADAAQTAWWASVSSGKSISAQKPARWIDRLNRRAPRHDRLGVPAKRQRHSKQRQHRRMRTSETLSAASARFEARQKFP